MGVLACGHLLGGDEAEAEEEEARILPKEVVALTGQPHKAGNAQRTKRRIKQTLCLVCLLWPRAATGATCLGNDGRGDCILADMTGRFAYGREEIKGGLS